LECGESSPLLFFYLECGESSPLLFFYLECGESSPLLFFYFLRKPEKKKKSGDDSPHSKKTLQTGQLPWFSRFFQPKWDSR